MVKFTKFGPRGIGAIMASRSRMGRAGGSTNASCVFYQDRTNYVIFTLRGGSHGSIAEGFAGNLWKVLLYRSSVDRFSARVMDAAGTILTTVTDSGGMAALATAVNANATLSPIVQMRVVGTIGATTDFSADLTDYCRFSGGS